MLKLFQFFALVLLGNKVNANGNLINPKIIGGMDANQGDVPWQVSLQFVWTNPVTDYRYSSRGHFCGGTIVDASHIVTAAHCIKYDFDRLAVVAGANNIRNKDEVSQQYSGIKRTVPHPRYNKVTIENDIAVIVLANPLNFTAEVQPLRLAPKGHVPSGRCLASGWGNDNNNYNRVPSILQKIELNTMARVPCRNKLTGLRASMVCAGGVVEKGTCMGDSGGPLTCFDLADGLPYLAGAVSWGKSGNCGQRGYPTVFANIAYLRPFLDAEIGKP